MLENRQLGHYRLLRRIGTGSMGEVYMAEDTRLARQVAIKVIRAEIDPYPDPTAIQDSQKLFMREMRTITRLDHPHILQLFDFGQERLDGGILTYMVMPWQQEGSLSEWLQRRGGRPTLAETAHFLVQAAEALQHAHDHAIVHQDVKPANFLVRNKAGNALPDILLSDFGIARAMSATSTVSQTVRGTPAYMAPEQWKGSPVPASDQYALGIMAYTLLTGQPPFSGRMEQVMHQHLMEQPPPLSKLNPAIPPDVDEVIRIALAKQPEKRFGSVTVFARAFSQAIQPLKDSFSNSTAIQPPTDQSTSFSSSIRRPASTSKLSQAIALISVAVLSIISTVVSIGTYQGHVNSANAAATAVANATATASAPAIPYPSYMLGLGNGKFVRLDSSSGLDTFSTASDPKSGNTCSHQNSALDVSQVVDANTFNQCYNANTDATQFGDFALEVQVEIRRGDCAVITIRGNSADTQYYFFGICSNGSYAITKYTNISNKPTDTLASGSSSVINIGIANTLGIMAKNSSMILYVNQLPVGSINDSSYSKGLIGLGAGANNDQTEVAYTNLHIWE